MSGITKEEFINRKISEIDKEIKQITDKSYDYRLFPSLGTAGFGVLALIFNVAIPGRALASLGAAGGCFLYNKYLKEKTEQKVAALQKEKAHLKKIKSGTVTDSPALNQKRRQKIRSLKKKNQNLMENGKNMNRLFGFTAVGTGVALALTVFNPVFALGTAAGLIAGSVLKGKKNKNNKEILSNEVRIDNLQNDLAVIRLASTTTTRAQGNTGLIKTPMSKTKTKKIDPKQEKIVDQYLASLENSKANYHAKQKVKK